MATGMMHKSKKFGPRGFRSNLKSFSQLEVKNQRVQSNAKKLGSKGSLILRFAKFNARNLTRAEAKFQMLLEDVSDGALRGRYESQYAISGKWIVDFFFPEVRLAVEIDGEYHKLPEQQRRDRLKEEDCARFDITLIRIANETVLKNPEFAIGVLREGWGRALRRENKLIGKAYDI